MNANVAQPEILHSHQSWVQIYRFRKQKLRTPMRRTVCAPEDALVCASVDAPFTCREARRSARRETRVSARRETRCSARRETRRSARREIRCFARRETRRFCARDVPGARRVRARKTCRVGAACTPGRPCFCGMRTSPSGSRNSAGAEGWLTAKPPQAAGSGGRPPLS